MLAHNELHKCASHAICRVALDETDAAKREPILHGLLDEPMHVSGDYLYQLDPDKYEIVAPSAIA